MSYPIWAILGEQQKKFVLILCQTRSQAKQHMMNLKRELEGNELLWNDLGPFKEEADEWGSSSLVFSKLSARISAASSEQSIRGLRHNQHRPDLIIGDDVEDLASVKTREGRQKTYQWLTGEVIPAGDRDTRLIVVGNMLHEDSLLMHLKGDVEEGRIDGVFKEYPLLDGQEIVAWPGKYPTDSYLEQEKKKTGNDLSWHREYLLQILSDSERVVHPEWLRLYSYDRDLPDDDYLHAIFIGVDFAVSQKDSADYVAIVIIKIYRFNKKFKAYVMPHPVNERLPFPDQVTRLKLLAKHYRGRRIPKIKIEKAGTQECLAQQLIHDGFQAEMVTIYGDKRERLAATTIAIQQGNILFPDEGFAQLRAQIIGFGVEKHDDLADAFSLVANEFIEYANKPIPGVEWV